MANRGFFKRVPSNFLGWVPRVIGNINIEITVFSGNMRSSGHPSELSVRVKFVWVLLPYSIGKGIKFIDSTSTNRFISA